MPRYKSYLLCPYRVKTFEIINFMFITSKTGSPLILIKFKLEAAVSKALKHSRNVDGVSASIDSCRSETWVELGT